MAEHANLLDNEHLAPLIHHQQQPPITQQPSITPQPYIYQQQYAGKRRFGVLLILFPLKEGFVNQIFNIKFNLEPL